MTWEYLVLRISAHFVAEVEQHLQQQLNLYAEDEWELIALLPVGESVGAMTYRAVLKRPARPPDPGLADDRHDAPATEARLDPEAS